MEIVIAVAVVAVAAYVFREKLMKLFNKKVKPEIDELRNKFDD